MSDEKMLKGSVKWFNDAKGYGFLTADGQDYFCHYSDIQASGHKSLEPYQAVEFRADKNVKGMRARDVRVVQGA